MKIGIVTVQVPFIRGGAEILCESLKNKLVEFGYQAEIITIPFMWYPVEILPQQILATRLLDVSSVDKIIAVKFPAYYIKHPNKTLWIFHQHRTAYDLYNTVYCDIPNTKEGQRIRDIIINCDNNYIKESKNIYTISKNVSNRLKKFNNIDSDVIYPPLENESLFIKKDYGDYVFYQSRLSRLKRQDLAILSLKYTKSNIKLIIAGKPDDNTYLMELKSLIKEHNLENRVKLIDSFIPDKDKIELYANALGVIYIPKDEDYGLVSLESFYSKNTLITCNDSGGVLEFADNENSFICENDPKLLALALDELYYNKSIAAKKGQLCYEKIISMEINWQKTITKLLK
jgi:glycosyltransferase involved in cell wall biosynthesis